MSLIRYKEQMDRINAIHELIRNENTGNSEEFAEHICISRSLLMDHLREMKELWRAPIDYCRKRNTFYYSKPFKLTILIEAELSSIKGGVAFQYRADKDFSLSKVGSIFWSLFFLLIFSSGYSQNYISEYYPAIHKAEKFILLGDQKSAFDVYKTILPKYERVFAKDLYNAIQCGNSVNESSDILFEWFGKLFWIGVSEDFLKKEVLAKLKNAELKSKIEKDWPSMKRDRDSKVDPLLRNKLSQLYKRDQRYRIKTGSYKVYKDSIQLDDRENLKELIGLVKKYGFPDEQQCGIQSPGERPDFFIVIHHFCQTAGRDKTYYNCCENEMIAMIEKAVASGKMQPSTASTYISWANIKSKRLSTMDYKLSKDEAEKGKIDDYRKLLGLLPVAENNDRQRMLSTIGNHNFIFEIK